MRAPVYPWELKVLFDGRPTVGWLMDLCEENYRHLLRLAPSVRTMAGSCVSRLEGHMDLHLEVLEQTPYTTLLHLTYFFSGTDTPVPDPNARIRVYHDSRQVEVVDLRQRALPLNMGIERPTMAQKWRVNMFLSKWLAYCVGQGHRFAAAGREMTPLSTPRLGLQQTC